MRKRLLAAALVLCMVISILPIGASAAQKSITDFIKLSANMDEQLVPKRTYNVRYWAEEEVHKNLTEDEITELANKYGISNEYDSLRFSLGLIFENGNCVGYHQAVKRDSQYTQEYMYYMPEELELTFEKVPNSGSDDGIGSNYLRGHIAILAYSDPDGDSIYDQRAVVGYRDRYNPVPASEESPIMGEMNWAETDGISTNWSAEPYEQYIGNNQFIPRKYTPACELSAGVMYIKSPVIITGADMKELFGPDTIVEIEVEADEVDPDTYEPTVTRGVYSFYIPGENTKTDPAASIGNKTYDTLAEAVEAAKSGDIIVLQKDYDGSKITVKGKSLTINCGQFTLDASKIAAGNNVTKKVTGTNGVDQIITLTYSAGSTGGGSTGGGGGGDSSSGGSTVTKPEDKKPEETVKKASEIFVDVDAGSWYEEAVTFAVEKGLFKGVDENHFAPAMTTTRAMIMTVLARLDGQKADTYDEAVAWATNKGVSDGSNINAVITREQFVTMLYRYAGQPQTKGQLTGFADVDEVSDWASHAMTWAVENGIVKGNEKSELSPLSGATRAEAAAIMQRYIELIEK